MCTEACAREVVAFELWWGEERSSGLVGEKAEKERDREEKATENEKR
jgi:hypothetical protein